MTIELHSVVVRTADLLSTPVDDEIVILNPERDNYVGLDAIGRSVWDLIEQPSEVAALCRTLGEEFDGTAEQIEIDVLAFLSEMADEGIVRVVAP
jgi:hypothetical protein